jgi:hypothetical protein
LGQIDTDREHQIVSVNTTLTTNIETKDVSPRGQYSSTQSGEGSESLVNHAIEKDFEKLSNRSDEEAVPVVTQIGPDSNF